MKTLLIIGRGIAAQYLKWKASSQFHIIQVASNDFAPACSVNSSAVVALRKTQKGITPLGDIIHDSFFSFEKFIEQNNPKGVEAVNHYQLWGEDFKQVSNWDKRYEGFNISQDVAGFSLKRKVRVHQERGFIIYTQKYLDWFDSEGEFQFVNDYIISLAAGKAIGRRGDYRADIIVCCAGVYSKLLLPDNRISQTKVVQGSYLEWENDFPQSFSLTFEEVNLIYKKKERKLLLGASSYENGFDFMPQKDQLRAKYEKINALLQNRLPSFLSAKIHTGLRHKGVKRKPYCGKTQIDGVFSIDSFHKNGWSYATWAGDSLFQEVLEG